MDHQSTTLTLNPATSDGTVSLFEVSITELIISVNRTSTGHPRERKRGYLMRA